MNYLVLLLIIIISTEIIIKFNYFYLISSLIKYISKANKLLINKNVSDHWKEKIIPQYSLMMMKYSALMLLIFLMIIILFLIVSIFINNFLIFTFSLKGLISSILFVFSYTYLKYIIKKWITIIFLSNCYINFLFLQN